MIDVNELVELTREQEQQSVFKLGTVMGLFESGAAKVQLDGEDTPSNKEYSYLASYIPRLNDRILLANIGGTHIILDAIYYMQAPDNSIKSDISALNEQAIEIEDDINTINGDIVSVNENLNTINGDINTINENISTINGNINTINNNLNNKVTKTYLYANKRIGNIFLDNNNNLNLKIVGGITLKFSPS